MLQQLMCKPGEITFREIDQPKPRAGEVLIRIRRIGICGSDIHVFHGEHPFTAYPVTQGHEVAGEIALLGDGVTDFKIGQKVTIQPQIVCGQCHPCRHGKYNLCEQLKVMGFQAAGFAAEYFAADQGRVTLLPDSMSFDEGALIEPLAVAVHAVRRFGDVSGKKVAVIGAGPIGNLVGQVAKAQGAASVLLTDLSEYRLSLALDCGIDRAVSTRDRDYGDVLLEAFGPDKADVIFDCAGVDQTINQAIRQARKGSVIILVAVFAKPALVDLAVLNDHELTLDSSMMYRNEDYLEAIRLLEADLVKLEPLISKHFKFREFPDAYNYIEANRETSMKIIIDVDR